MFNRRPSGLAAIAIFVAIPCVAQDQPPAQPKPGQNSAAPVTNDASRQPNAQPPAAPLPAGEENGTQPGVVQDKRAFGVLPNYRTADGTVPYTPITTKQKFTIAEKDTLDWPSYILGGVFAGISQIDNSNPSFGQGFKGYAHRYVTNTADQDIGNFMTEAIMPTFLHEDPRYFRKVNGSTKSRLFYAATRVVIGKNDQGRNGFNFAEFLGNGTVAALGNAYYPDARGFSPTMQRMFTQIGTDAISQIGKEFWPDIKRKWLTRKEK